MLKVILFIIMLSLQVAVYLQPWGAASATLDIHKKVFANTVKAGDYVTAINAANYIIAAAPTSTYRDSVAILYVNTGNYNAAYYWSNAVLKTTPTNTAMLEIKALSLKNGNRPVEAIDAYTALVKVKPNVEYAFEIMQLQYNIKRLAECAATGHVSLKMPIDTNLVVNYAADANTRMQTPMKAALYNLLGMAQNGLEQYKEAKLSYEAALKVDARYTYAIANLEALNKVLAAKEATKKEAETKKKE
jgi:tetratricopeptide (TPR) repeat protein